MAPGRSAVLLAVCAFVAAMTSGADAARVTPVRRLHAHPRAAIHTRCVRVTNGHACAHDAFLRECCCCCCV
jgi:hypothetical protein